MALDEAWRGPRPLGSGDELIGRGRELDELVDRCLTYDVVQITAPSGVGKTSFISAGGSTALAEEGFHVPPPRPWSELTRHEALAGLEPGRDAAHVVYQLAIGVEPSALRSLDVPVAQIVTDVAAGRRMAVVLDQLEELLRYRSALGDALLGLAGEAARDSHVPHVVIARSEYRDRLRPLQVRSVQVWNLYLEEIRSEKALRRIIADPAKAAGVAIDDAAVDQVLEWWNDAKGDVARSSDESSETFGGVGLLHLQSLLWSFGRWAARQDVGDRITVEHLDRFAQAHAGRLDGGDASRVGGKLIEGAVVGYVRDRIAQATAAPRVDAGTPEERELEWTNGPRLMLSRIGTALSSAGYKVPQAESSLITLALAEDLTQRGARELAQTLATGGDLEAYVERTTFPLAGVAAIRGWDHRRAIMEMVDALRSIVQALSTEQSNILRPFLVREHPVYELVHDGIGPALAKWSQEFSESVAATLEIVAAPPGRALWHSLDPETFLDASGEVDPHWRAVSLDEREGRPIAVLEALQVASNYIGPRPGEPRSSFRRLTFRGCDFTGAAFVGCDLEDVVFDRCVMRGAVMIGCNLEGVCFTADPARTDELDLLTIKSSRAVDVVRFENLSGTTGLFLQELTGGEWHLVDANVRHLVVSATAPSRLVLAGGTVRHASVTGDVDIDRNGCEMYYEELPE